MPRRIQIEFGLMLDIVSDIACKDLVQLNVNYDKNQTEFIKINDRYNDQQLVKVFLVCVARKRKEKNIFSRTEAIRRVEKPCSARWCWQHLNYITINIAFVKE